MHTPYERLVRLNETYMPLRQMVDSTVYEDDPSDSKWIVVKDNVHVEGFSTECGLGDRDFGAGVEAGVVRSAKSAGYRVLGKAKVEPLAMSGGAASPFDGTWENPTVQGAIPGGSSGGVASAVAAGLARWGIGTDTGGSVRVPAAFTGTYGYRPPTDALTKDGMSVFSPHFDTPGVIGLESSDLALAYEAIGGTWTGPRGDPRPMLIVEEDFSASDPVVAHACEQALAILRGIRLTKSSANPIGSYQEVQTSFQVVCYRDAWMWNRDSIAGIPESVLGVVGERLRWGEQITHYEYSEALGHLRDWQAHTLSILDDHSCLVLPVCPIGPPMRGVELSQQDVARMGAFTNPWSAAHLAALAVPLPGDLGVGLQIVAPPSRQGVLLQVASELEQSLGLASSPVAGI